MSRTAEIKLLVHLDDNKIPDHIEWRATDDETPALKSTKAFFLNVWDSSDKQSLGMHLWTNKMTIEEMHHFVFQSMIQLSEVVVKATNNETEAQNIKETALAYIENVQEKAEKK